MAKKRTRRGEAVEHAASVTPTSIAPASIGTASVEHTDPVLRPFIALPSTALPSPSKGNSDGDGDHDHETSNSGSSTYAIAGQNLADGGVTHVSTDGSPPKLTSDIESEEDIFEASTGDQKENLPSHQSSWPPDRISSSCSTDILLAAVRALTPGYLGSIDQVTFNKNGCRIIKDPSLVAPLAAVSLSAVCKEMYTDVSLTHMFYTNNVFDFTSYRSDVLTYLVAITQPRRDAIKTISMYWHFVPFWGRKLWDMPEIWTLIASCEGLKSLQLNFSNYYMNQFLTSGRTLTRALAGLKEAKVAVRGLDLAYKLIVDDFHEDFQPSPPIPKTVQDKFLEDVSNALPKSSDMERTGTANNLKLLQTAKPKAKLNIYGEGRLSNDKKPGQVSSRTRGGMQKVEHLSDKGTLPERQAHRYDTDGLLLRDVVKCMEKCRVVTGEDGGDTVEFLVETHEVSSPFWEDATALNDDNRGRILAFYKKNPGMPGKSIVLRIWKEFKPACVDGEYHSKPARSLRRAKAYDEKALIALIEKEANKEKDAEEAEKAEDEIFDIPLPSAKRVKKN
ncbi:hypothetical protein MBM_03645 [Drepanopeziza brunnea f. sp. 'multigermtubi' MB_m1]|uniref:DUF7730 domain-containing protein n=1 Tax=Marssonina brunnea f. sp. multigermtubi (strain MB_m1) TaxID=1072389 RepID=K1XAW3_MARBU|nr:uncharacterized protein MBM_03645 [Drepanopeziza brunnea f. sp. 'multigermtubi' MB_m1]EKD17873.1 hypothetical protein MBM_03645 [Drepanopeziza brunnea f. sp. 'multigermtubi' MB_m1]